MNETDSNSVCNTLYTAHCKYRDNKLTFTRIRGIKVLRETFGLGFVEANRMTLESGYPFEVDGSGPFINLDEIRARFSINQDPVECEQ